MGYVVLHLSKASGKDAEMSAHIERRIHPKNADESRTHLNRELITFPEGVTNRTDAIQHRIDHAGITRKISPNQVRAIRVMLSATHEDMKWIEDNGQLDGWCQDNIRWLQDTFGKENVVSAVLHMDEKTPHLHATVVPIVTGERRKAKSKSKSQSQADNEAISTKRHYKKKNPNAARLCADDVMARDKLKFYQSDYAERMTSYGLNRGVDGSEARHITTQQYYRDLYVTNEELKADIKEYEQQKQNVYEQVRDMYDLRDEARDKYLKMDEHVKSKQKELATTEACLQDVKQEYEPYKAQVELNLIHELMPEVKEKLRIASICMQIGIAVKHVKALLAGRTLTSSKPFTLFSPEHNRKFIVENMRLKMEQEPDNPNRLRLMLNGVNILDWFREKAREVKQRVMPKRSGGMKV
jgi:hypothetical protein